MMTPPITVSLTADELDFLRVCDELHVTIQRTPGHSEIRDITLGKARYSDRVAADSCTNIRCYKFADTLYTVCQHGLIELGYLRRELTNGRHTK